MSRRNVKDMKVSAQIVELLKQAQALSMQLSPQASRGADVTIGYYSLGQAQERYWSAHVLACVAHTNKLPEEP